MPTCITLNSNVDFTVTSLSAPQDGYSISIAQATPTPTPTDTSAPVATPTPTPSPTPAASFSTDACSPSSPTGYGSGFTMSITFQSSNAGDPTSYVWFQLDQANRLLHIDNAVDMGLDSAGLVRAAFFSNDPGCPGPSNPVGTQALKYSDLTGAGKDLASVTLVGLAYTTSTVGGGPGPYTVWFE
jgi:hypothetical protein